MFPFELFKKSGEEQAATSEKVENKEKMEETKKKEEKNALAQQKERQIRDVISIALGH